MKNRVKVLSCFVALGISLLQLTNSSGADQSAEDQNKVQTNYADFVNFQANKDMLRISFAKDSKLEQTLEIPIRKDGLSGKDHEIDPFDRMQFKKSYDVFGLRLSGVLKFPNFFSPKTGRQTLATDLVSFVAGDLNLPLGLGFYYSLGQDYNLESEVSSLTINFGAHKQVTQNLSFGWDLDVLKMPNYLSKNLWVGATYYLRAMDAIFSSGFNRYFDTYQPDGINNFFASISRTF